MARLTAGLERLLRRDLPAANLVSDIPQGAGLYQVQSTDRLLADPVVAKLVEDIQGIVDVGEPHWTVLYHNAIRQFASWVQLLPASEYHHHSAPGGLLIHTLETVRYALLQRQGLLLPPGAEVESRARVQPLWTYAVFTAALMHDAGKPVCDHAVTLTDPDGGRESKWNPWKGPMPVGRHYRVAYNRGHRYELHPRIAVALLPILLPIDGLAWLSGDQQAFGMVLAAIGHQYELAGPVGEVLVTAEGESVRRYNGGDPSAPMAATSGAIPLHQKILTAIRVLLDEPRMRLNKRGGAAWLVGDDVWLVSARIAEAVRAHLTEEGHSGIPTKNPRIFDVLQEHGILSPTPGDKAIWHAHVQIEDQNAELTLLRVPVARLWPDPASRPPDSGAVITLQEELLQNTEEPEAEPEALNNPGGAPEEAAAEASIDVNRADEASPAAMTAPPAPSSSTVGAPLFGASNSEPPSTNGPTQATSQGDKTPASAAADHAKSEGASSQQSGAGNSQPEGRAFMAWLVSEIEAHRVNTNNAKALVHTFTSTEGGIAVLLVSPRAFQLYVDQNSTCSLQWKGVQKEVQRLRLHKKNHRGENIHELIVTGQSRITTIRGLVFENPVDVFGSANVPSPNPHIKPTEVAR